MDSTSKPAPGKSPREGAWVGLFLLAFLAVNLLTATRYPVPWADECDIAEPAVSFLHGQGFVIRFSEILSLYTFLLVPWMKLFGATLLALRAACILSSTAALGLLWSAVKRLGLVGRASGRLFLLLLLMTEYAMIFACRDGRYDGFGCLLMAASLWMMSIPRRRPRVLSVAILSLFLAWAGLQYLPLLFVAGAVLLLFFRRRYVPEVAAASASAALGAALFFASVYAAGRLPGLLHFMRAQPSGPTILLDWIRHKGFHQANYIPKDFSLPSLAAAAVSLWFARRQEGNDRFRFVLGFGLVFALLLSVVMLAAAKLPTYYCYMLAIPLSISIASALDLAPRCSFRNAALALCSLSALAGAGLNLAVCLSDWRDRDYARVEHFIAQSIQPGDTAYVDAAGYLAARPIARDVYLPEVAGGDILDRLSPPQKASITVLVIRPEDAARVVAGMGGKWMPTGQRLAPVHHMLFAGHNLGFLSLKPADLVAFRRF